MTSWLLIIAGALLCALACAIAPAHALFATGIVFMVLGLLVDPEVRGLARRDCPPGCTCRGALND